MVSLISRQRGGLAALKLTKLFGIDDFPAAKASGKVLITIIYCYLIIIIFIIIIIIIIIIISSAAESVIFLAIADVIIADKIYFVNKMKLTCYCCTAEECKFNQL